MSDGRTVAALFVRSDSVYKSMPGVDPWDAERDARLWPGGAPVVAHPPCRAWGRLRHFAKPRPDEKACGPWAVDRVREFGGVLEHPASSSLWLFCALPPPGVVDLFGGYTYPVVQSWWGHRAVKATWLYIVGCRGGNLPDMPGIAGPPSRLVAARAGHRKGMPGWLPDMRTAEREHSPPEFAQWLVEVARRCVV